ncbi:hypothetical protein BS78_09G063000 [Paspalum vaginatum]|nr:hypothetical protein BS78_09G063000 [Paspalum vaginatum]
MIMAAAGKKPRKPYKITRPREKWAADEHERFLHALLLFGRDWKSIERFVTTKTSTQIRSHAQKYFLKAQKLGLAAALPPPQLRRGAGVLASQYPYYPPCIHPDYGEGDAAAVGSTCTAAPAPPVWPLLPSTPPVSSMDLTAPLSGGARESADWAPSCATAGAHHQFHHRPSCGSRAAADATLLPPAEDEGVMQLPLSPDDPRFAQVYRFVGDVFGSGALEAQLQRLRGVDPAVVDTILLVLRNVEDNLFA